MKKIFTVIFLLFLVNITFAQTEEYSKIIIYSSSSEIQKLREVGISLEDMSGKQDLYYILELSKSEIQKVENLGLQYEILIRDLSYYYSERYANSVNKKPENLKYVTPENFHLGSMGGFLTLDEVYAELDEMTTLYPNLISIREQISETTTIEGRNLYYIKISDNPNVNEDEAEVLYTSLHHAREPQSMQGVIYYMWYLLENYETDSEIKYLVDNLEMYFVPIVNPDGYEHNRATDPNGGGMWRKNMRDNDGSGSFEAEEDGVDLNRNYGFQWGYDNNGSSPDPSTQTYRGTEAFSEAETQIIRDFCLEHNFLLAHNHHTYSNLVIIPYGYEEINTEDDDILRTYAYMMASENGYTVGQGWEILYTVNGDSNDWMYGEQTEKNKIFPFTQETGNNSDGFWPEQNRIIPLSEEMYLSNLYLARFATEYAEISDGASAFKPRSDYLQFDLKRFGLNGDGNYNIEITSENNVFSFIQAPISMQLNDVLETKTDSFGYVLSQDVNYGDEFSYTITVTAGEYSVSKTFTKQFYETEIIISDDGNSIDNWTTSSWNITDETFVSSTHSITDSPLTDYSNDANSTITLTNAIDLTDINNPTLTFWAKWDIENDWDYVQLSISTDDGSTWIPLSGNYTNLGTGSFQPQGEPLYDNSTANAWVNEEIDLSSYIGESVKFKYQLVSDGAVTLDGFYFDDFQIINLLATPSGVNINSETEISLYPNPAKNCFFISNKNLDINSISIIDINGRKIKTIIPTKKIACISCNEIPSGIYFVKLFSNNLVYTKKLIIK